MNKDIIFNEIKTQSDLIENSYKINKEIIPLIAKTIKAFKPNNIVIIGNEPVSYYTKYLFEIYYNIPVSIISPIIYTTYNSNLNLKKSLVIAISPDGNNKDILDVCKKANENGAITLSITNNEKTIISNECKYDLYTNIGNEDHNFTIKSFTTTIYLLTKLIYEITSIAELDIDEHRVIESLNNSIKYYEQIKNDIDNFKNNNFLIIYSGYNYFIARELTNKLNKICNKFATCISIEDMNKYSINSDLEIIVIAIDKYTNNNINNIINKVNNDKNYIYTITNIGNILNNSDNGINILEDNDFYTIFTCIGILQLLILELKK